MENQSRLLAKDWNILVFSSDQHNAKMMGCAGHPVIETPSLDRLAKEGTLFTRAYSPYPTCAPTRQSFITGRHPKEHGQIKDSYYFDKRNMTLAHHFKKHGYTTACIGKMHTNHEEFGFGYDYRRCSENFPQAMKEMAQRNAVHMDKEDEKLFKEMTDNKYWSTKSRLYGMVAEDGRYEHDGMVTADAIRFLNEHQHDKFFLHVSLVKPHYPWVSPAEYYYKYSPQQIDMPKQHPTGLEQNYMGMKRITETGWDRNTQDQIRLCRARYYGNVSWMDSHLGQILDTLDQLDLSKKTLVLYFSDHGEMAGEKGLWLKALLYESAVRVPMIVRMPGVVPAGVKNDQFISHVDLFPTLAALVGAEADLPDTITGTDRSGSILRDEEGSAYVFSMEGLTPDWDAPPEQFMVCSKRWKLLRFQVDDPSKQFVLYDLENDPEEIVNLAYEQDYQQIVRSHLEAGERFFAGLRKPPYELACKSD